VPTNQQRRESERRRLQHQLEERRAREAQRKRFTLIGSVIGTLVAIGAIVGIVLATTGGNDKKGPQSGGEPDTVSSPAATTGATTSPAASAPPVTLPTAPCAAAPKGDKATFQGVTVTGATDLKHAPKVTSLSQRAPASLTCQDLVVGKGKPAAPTSTVSVQYIGALYKNGQQFDSSWSRGGKAVSFSLSQVVPGFTQGIGGAGKVAPMREGGRRIMILPSALGYGASGNGSIPANAPLVFIVDLTSVSAAS
jgi:FKBP-type peptidyl-prolyl cis-trans isomerase